MIPIVDTTIAAVKQDFFSTQYVKLLVEDSPNGHEGLYLQLATQAKLIAHMHKFATRGLCGVFEPVFHEIGHVVTVEPRQAFREDDHMLIRPKTRRGERCAISHEINVYAVAETLLRHYELLQRPFKTVIDAVIAYDEYDPSDLPGFFQLGSSTEACWDVFKRRVRYATTRISFPRIQAAWQERIERFRRRVNRHQERQRRCTLTSRFFDRTVEAVVGKS